MSPRPDEKRQHVRVPFVLRVDYANGLRIYDATENVSEGGVFIQTDQRFSVGQTLPVSLSFPGLLDPLELVGKVAWIRAARADQPGGVGLRVEREVDRLRLLVLMKERASHEKGRALVHPASGYRVLIVEDNPHVIEMYAYALKKLATGTLGGKVPLEVDFAPDGHAALGRLAQGTYSLVMTDLYMPVMDGFALVERIRHDEGLKRLPVIAISAGGSEEQDRATHAGVDIYLRKPVKFVEVLETVKQLLQLA